MSIYWKSVLKYGNAPGKWTCIADEFSSSFGMSDVDSIEDHMKRFESIGGGQLDSPVNGSVSSPVLASGEVGNS